MKEYPSIPGWKNASLGLPCIAFEKLDGSNIRAEWHRKRGFNKYGSRSVLLDKNHPILGEAIPLFEKTLAEPLGKIFKLLSCEECIVFMEFFGPSSFAGQHINEPKKLIIFDVNVHKKGIIVPREFIKIFADLPIPKVVYDGNFNRTFIDDVRNGKYDVGEGVVAKGLTPGKKTPHGLWYAKVKTNKWMQQLKEFSANNTNLQKEYEENMKEQN